MIILCLIYIAFQLLFDHWGDNTVTSKVIYFAFQYGWIGALALYQAFKKKYVPFYLIFALSMFVISINELRYLNSDVQTYAMMSASPPAYLLTCITVILFLIYEIIMRWKKRLNLRGQN